MRFTSDGWIDWIGLENPPMLVCVDTSLRMNET